MSDVFQKNRDLWLIVTWVLLALFAPVVVLSIFFFLIFVNICEILADAVKTITKGWLWHD
jgi:hypothetical protein